MKVSEIMFPDKEAITFLEVEKDLESAGSGVIVDTEYTILSAGTELACLRGSENWVKYPFSPGYGCVGKVSHGGTNGSSFKAGDRIFHWGPHASISKATGLAVKLPEGLDPKLAVLARMGQVSFTAVRLSNVELGDFVAVQGLGLVGNMAAQLMGLSGATVIGIDVSEKRLETARKCGIEYTLNPESENLGEGIKRITGGRMCNSVVEATGVANLVEPAMKLAGKGGEVILLGTPRGKLTGEPENILSDVFAWNSGCITLKGAHEWRFPRTRENEAYQKHSMERNVDILFHLMLQGKLKIEELITHVVSPAKCEKVYRDLQSSSDDYLGVIFDWAN